MTISTTTIKNSYSGNDSTDAFSYTFKITADSEMQVIIRSSTGSETVKSLTTHYTVSGAGNASGGTVTFTSGNIPATGETVILRRNTTKTQGSIRDSYSIRRTALTYNIPYYTTIRGAKIAVDAIEHLKNSYLKVTSLQDLI